MKDLNHVPFYPDSIESGDAVKVFRGFQGGEQKINYQFVDLRVKERVMFPISGGFQPPGGVIRPVRSLRMISSFLDRDIVFIRASRIRAWECVNLSC